MQEQPSEMNYELAQKTQRDYVCAVCWSHLIVKFSPSRAYGVECGKYGTEHAGYVTKTYAQRRLSESAGELAEARQNLSAALGIKTRRSESDILKDLGF